MRYIILAVIVYGLLFTGPGRQLAKNGLVLARRAVAVVVELSDGAVRVSEQFVEPKGGGN